MDTAATVVPANALAYLSVSLDTGRAPVRRARSLARELPGLRRLRVGLQARLDLIAGVLGPAEIDSWIGSEVAVAFLPAGTGAQELIVLDIAHPRTARRFLAHGRPAGVAARILDGQMVLGAPDAVAAAAATAAHPGTSLQALASFRAAEAAQPARRVINAWATGTGILELLGGHGGVRGVLAALLGGDASAAAALSPTGHGLRVSFELSRHSDAPGSAGSFTPTLLGRLPARTLWAVDMASLTGSGPGLLAALAAGSRAGPAAGLSSRLAVALRAQGVAPRPLAELFSQETTIFSLDGGLGLMARVRSTRAARLELGRAGAAIVGLFAPTVVAGVEPVVATVTVAGQAVTRWQQGPAQLDVAVAGGTVLLTQSAAAIAAVLGSGPSLAANPSLSSVLTLGHVAAGPVLFGAINRLVRHRDQSGLLESLGLAGATATLARISAVGLTSTGGGRHIRARLTFTIS